MTGPSSPDPVSEQWNSPWAKVWEIISAKDQVSMNYAAEQQALKTSRATRRCNVRTTSASSKHYSANVYTDEGMRNAVR